MPKKPEDPSLRRSEAKPLPAGGKGAKQIPRPEPVYDDPRGRARYFRRSRTGVDRKMLRGAILKASVLKRFTERNLLEKHGFPARPTPPGGSGSVNWASLGPTKVDGGQAGATRVVVSGRVTAIVVGPGGTRVYVGTANGGVWITEDAGSTWAALDEFANTPAGGSGTVASNLEADSLAVGAVTVKFGTARGNDLVFVGTGEPGAGVDGYFGIGIKSSSDGGATFSLEATNLASTEIYRIVIDPDDPTIVFAATTSGLYQRPTTAPFTNWNQITSTFANANGAASYVIVAGTGATKAYYVGFDSDTVYKSPDGAAWNAVPGFSGSGRIVLAAGENDPSVIYALVSDGTLNRMDSGTGGNFQAVSGVPRALFAGGQGSYDEVVAVDPTNANTIYLVGDLTLDSNDWALSIYKGTITGSPGSYVFPFNAANDQTTAGDARTTTNVASDPTWIGSGIHPDGHALAFATKADGTHDGSIVWVGSDGGVFASTSSGALKSFSAKNQGLNLTQMTYIGLRPDTADVLYGGCQDNGTIRFSLAGTKSWLEVVEGDGGGVAIDPNKPAQVIRQYIRADLSVSNDDGANWASAGLPVAGGSAEDIRSGFYGPIKSLAAGAKTVVAFGTNRLWWRTDWSDAWQSLPSNSSTDVLDDPTPNDTTNPPPSFVPVTAIAIASGTRVYAATSQVPAVANGAGQVWRFDFASGAWTKTALPALPSTVPSVRFFTALSVEDPVAGTVYVTVGSGGGEHVFYFDGTAWASAGFSATNVDVPTHAVAVDPDNPADVYVGTDVGVWKGTRSGTSWTWTPFSQGLPEAAVTDLAVHSASRKLRAATHGRGVWEIALGAASSSSSSGSSSSSDSSSSGDSSSSSDGSSSSDSSSSGDSSSSSDGSSSSDSSSSGDSSSSSDGSSSSDSSSSGDSSSSSDGSSSSDSSSSGESSSSSDGSSSSDSSSSGDSSSSSDGSSSSDSSSSGDSSSSSDGSSSDSSGDSSSSSDGSSSDSSGDSSSSDGGAPSRFGGAPHQTPKKSSAQHKPKKQKH